MAINPSLIEVKKVTELVSKLPFLQAYFAHCGEDGVLYKATLDQLATFLAPYITAIGGSGFVATTGTVLPTASAGKFTIVDGPATFTQAVGGSITTVSGINILSSSATTWSVAKNIPLPEAKLATLGELPSSVNKTGIVTTGFSYSSTGTLLVRGTASYTAKIPIIEGTDIWVQATSTLNTVYIVFFDVDGVFIPGSAILSRFAVLTKISIPVGAKQIALSGDTTTPLILEFRSLSYVQIKTTIEQNTANIATNTTEITTNKADIQRVKDEGYLNVDVTPTLVAGYYTANGTAPTGQAGYVSTPKIPIVDLETLLVTNTRRTGFQDRIVFFQADGTTFISQLQESNVDAQLTYPALAKFFAISQGSASVPAIKIIKYGKYKKLLDEINPRLAEVELKVATGGLGVANAESNRFLALGEANVYRMATLSKPNYTIFFEGQSNASDPGYAPYAKIAELGLPNTTVRVVKWNGTAFVHYDLPVGLNWGPYWSVLYRLDAYLTVPIQYYNNGVGGTDLYTAWNPDRIDPNALANRSARATTLIKSTNVDSNIKCVVWIQGESDQESPKQEAYYQNLKNYISFRRGTIGNPSVAFIVVGLHPLNSLGTLIPNRKAIYDIQKKVCDEDPHAYFIDPISFPYTTVDGTHYDAAYNENVGVLIFNVIKDL